MRMLDEKSPHVCHSGGRPPTVVILVPFGPFSHYADIVVELKFYARWQIFEGSPFSYQNIEWKKGGISHFVEPMAWNLILAPFLAIWPLDI